jgi:hypothetical protein
MSGLQRTTGAPYREPLPEETANQREAAHQKYWRDREERAAAAEAERVRKQEASNRINAIAAGRPARMAAKKKKEEEEKKKKGQEGGRKRTHRTRHRRMARRTRRTRR